MDETPQFELIPGSHRATDRVANLLRRVPPLAWPFIALAGLRWLVFIVASGGHMDVWTFLGLVNITAWTLLPAAVIIGRPDAWRSARAILLGAIAWSTIGAVSSLIWGVGAVAGSDQPFSDARLSVSLVGEIVGLAAPLVIAYDLAFRRRTTTSWPRPVIVLAVAGTAAALWWTTSTALDWYNSQMGIGAALSDEPARQLLFLDQILSPLALLSLGVIAWSGMSAVRADEQPRRFWIALTAGSVALLVLHVYEHLASWVVPTIGFSQTVTDLYLDSIHIEYVVAVAGIALLLLAFGFGVPNVVDPNQEDVTLESGKPDPAVSAELGAPGDLPA